MPRGDHLRTRGSRFQLLSDHLAAQGGDEIVLALDQIETIIGHPLSLSMQTGPERWTMATTAPVRCWRAVGWHARLDIKGRCVRFARDAEAGDG